LYAHEIGCAGRCGHCGVGEKFFIKECVVKEKLPSNGTSDGNFIVTFSLSGILNFLIA